jgi:hypothetical protein
MKTVRTVAFVLALTLLVAAVVPFAAKPVSAQVANFSKSDPVQTFADAALGLPMLAPMSVAAIPVFSVSVESPAAGSDYSCTLISQKPLNWTKMERRQIFDAFWTVKNSGNRVWGQHGVDFAFVSGTKMHTDGSGFDFQKDVGKGQKIKFVVDMTTPKTKGVYSTTWGLFTGGRVFCKLGLTVNVNK